VPAGNEPVSQEKKENMLLWAVPAPMDGHDLQKAVAGNRLVDKVINAGKSA